jgi:hypothetical protein
MINHINGLSRADAGLGFKEHLPMNKLTTCCMTIDAIVTSPDLGGGLYLNVAYSRQGKTR